MFSQGYSLVVERRSSKSHAWVRFPLSLINKLQGLFSNKQIFFQKYFCNFKPAVRNKKRTKLQFQLKLYRLKISVLLLFLKISTKVNRLSALSTFFLGRILVFPGFIRELIFVSKRNASCFITLKRHINFFFLFFNVNTNSMRFNYCFAKNMSKLRLPQIYLLSRTQRMQEPLDWLRPTCRKVEFVPGFLKFFRSSYLKKVIRYFLFSTISINAFTGWFKSNLSSFASCLKKRLIVRDFQSVQSSGGYTGRYLFFLKSILIKKIPVSESKVLAYLSAKSFRVPQNAPYLSLNVGQPRNTANFYLTNFLNVNLAALAPSLFFKPIIFKYFSFFFKNALNWIYTPEALLKTFRAISPFYRVEHFVTNVFAFEKFSLYIKKYFSYVAAHNKYNFKLLAPFQISIMRFIQFCSGRHVLFKVCPFSIAALSLQEHMQCAIWAQKMKYYRRILGPRLLLNESLQMLYICLKHKDIHLFSNWATSMFYKISFWKYKTFLRYLKYVLRHFFLGIYQKLEFKGIKYRLKGKISVAGNSRTRTSYHYVGFTSHATFNNKILTKLNLVRTFTGVLGFKIWFVF